MRAVCESVVVNKLQKSASAVLRPQHATALQEVDKAGAHDWVRCLAALAYHLRVERAGRVAECAHAPATARLTRRPRRRRRGRLAATRLTRAHVRARAALLSNEHPDEQELAGGSRAAVEREARERLHREQCADVHAEQRAADARRGTRV